MKTIAKVLGYSALLAVMISLVGLLLPCNERQAWAEFYILPPGWEQQVTQVDTVKVEWVWGVFQMAYCHDAQVPSTNPRFTPTCMGWFGRWVRMI